MKHILSQMFDIRPRDFSGEVDVPRMTKLSKTLDLRGETPPQPSLPMSIPVAVTRQEQIEMQGRQTIALKRRGTLRPRSQVAAEDIRPIVVVGATPKQAAPPAHLPIVEDHTHELGHRGAGILEEELHIPVPDEELLIPAPQTRQRIPWSFAFAVLVAMLLVPAMAFVGSARSLAQTLESQVADAAGRLTDASRAMAALEVGAGSQFAEAARQFEAAQERLADVGFGVLSLLAEIPVSQKLTSGKAILEGGEHLARAGQELSASLAALAAFNPEQFFADVFSVSVDEASAAAAHAAGVAFEDGLITAAEELELALDALERVHLDSVPEAYQAKLSALLASIPTIRTGVDAIHSHARSVAGIIGMREVRRYLVLLGNASELRPTGGFVGNVALLTVANGRLIDLRVEDTYLFDGQITRYTVPPVPIQDISAAWSLHDANWYRHFPTSAAIAADFYEVSGEATPDGVFMVTSAMIERLLAVVGPLELESGDVLSAENFVDTLNAIGAVQRPGETTQARAVAAALPLLLERVAQADDAQGEMLQEALSAAITAGDMQVWFRSADEQAIAETLGLDGGIPETDGDVLGIVHANVNGYKTDRVMSETVLHEATVDRSGAVTVDVTIRRHHHGNEAKHTFYREVNKDYLRVLVPTGSTLLAADGFTCKPEPPVHALDYVAADYLVQPLLAESESTYRPFADTCASVGKESGLSAFSGWVFTSPGETTQIHLRYRLPFRLEDETDAYRLLALKQPGFVSAFSSRLVVQPPWSIVWTDEGLLRGEDGLYAPLAPLEANRFFGAVLAK